MKLLLDDCFAPLTSTIGFVEAPLTEVAAAVLRWRREGAIRSLCDLWAWHKRKHPGAVLSPELRDPRNVSHTMPLPEWADLTAAVPVNEPFPEVLFQLEPLVLAPAPLGNLRELLLETHASWTAYLMNGIFCRDVITPMSHLCRKLQCRALLVTCEPNTITGKGPDAKGRHGAVQFHLFSPECPDSRHYLRAVELVGTDGKWEFGANGQVQPFERVERYRARRLRDRFTPEMLGEYCEALGIVYFDPTFYGPRGVLIRPRTEARDETARTLAEARRELDIEE